MKIALVGGAGFIGSRLAEMLLPEHEIRILDVCVNPRFAERTAKADVRDYGALLAHLAGCEAVVLLAAEHRDDVTPISLYYDVNAGGAGNVAKAAAALGIKSILFTSSVAVYGPSDDELSEDTLPSPASHYGKSKLEAEKILGAWAAQDEERFLLIVRPTVVFGPGNRGNVYNLFRQIASGKFVMIGNGRNRKSMAYVDNVAAFLRHCLMSFSRGIHLFNYADKPDFCMQELAALVRSTLKMSAPRCALPLWIAAPLAEGLSLLARLFGARSPVNAARARKFCANTRFSADRALQLGFKPLISLPEGVRSTLEAEFPPGANNQGRHA